MRDHLRSREGMAFSVVTLPAPITTSMVGTDLSSSLGKASHVEQQIRETSAFDAAEAGLDEAAADLRGPCRRRPAETRVLSLVGPIGPKEPFRVPRHRVVYWGESH